MYIYLYIYNIFIYIHILYNTSYKCTIRQVVAPVRETTAQVLGIISSHLPDVNNLQNLFLQLLQCEEWQARHGGLLAIKYFLAARQVCTQKTVIEPSFGHTETILGANLKICPPK